MLRTDLHDAYARCLGKSFEARVRDADEVLVCPQGVFHCKRGTPDWDAVFVDNPERSVKVKCELTVELLTGVRAAILIDFKQFLDIRIRLRGDTDPYFCFYTERFAFRDYVWYRTLIRRPACPVCENRKKLSLFGRFRKCPLCGV
jgi:hypothetical protein